MVATCGGKLVCLIDCQTGKVLRRYKDNSKSEVQVFFIVKYSNIWTPGAGCSKLTTSLVNVLLKFQT